MEKKAPPKPNTKGIFEPPKIPSAPPRATPPTFQCPFTKVDEESTLIRRQDLLDLGDTLSAAARPMSQLTNLVREQNDIQRDTNKYVRVTSKRQANQGWVLLALTIMVASVAVVQIHASVLQEGARAKQEEVVESIAKTQAELDSLTIEMRGLVALTKKTKEGVEDIKEEQADKASVQLVPETDPVKAKKSPVKVRIVPPRPRSSSGEEVPFAPSAAVELPVSGQSAKAVR